MMLNILLDSDRLTRVVKTYLITSEASIVVHNHFKPIRVLQQLYARRSAEVSIRVVAMPKCQLFKVVMIFVVD